MRCYARINWFRDNPLFARRHAGYELRGEGVSRLQRLDKCDNTEQCDEYRRRCVLQL